MNSNWTKGKLEELAIIEMGQSPLGETCNQEGIGTPLLNGPTEFGEYHPTPVQFTTKARKFSVPNDILFCVRGSTTGSMNWADQKYAIGRGIAAMRHRSGTDYKYFLKALIELHLDQLLASATGSTFPNVSREQLANLDCEIPPLPEQRAIAGILGALDDKIELNRHMNVTLEAMARAVFLEMMKNGEGEERTIGDVVTVVGGSTPSTTNPAFWDGGVIHWATPKDLAHLQSPILLDSNSCISELGLKGISSGLLPIGTVLLSSRAPIGYLAITQIPVAINQGFIAIKCTEEVPNYFILNWLKENMEEIIGRANGTTFLEISKSNFRPMKVIVPLPRKMKAFVVQVEPMYLKIVANLKEARTLARLRDSLLPKLMRGDVSVKGIER
jgi:type I restriction enzyme S subunit